MNNSSKHLIIIALVLTFLNVSCNKMIDPENERSVTTEEQKKHLVNDVLSNQVLIDWNLVAFEVAGNGAPDAHALLASRSNAMMHIAMHDALNAIHPIFEQYAYHNLSPGADPFAAAASAAATVLNSLWPSFSTLIEAKLASSLAGIPDGNAKTKGIALVPVSTVAGVYNSVPPLDFLFAPFWKDMQPFAIESPDQFRLSPPPSLTSPIYTRSFNEIKEAGELNSTVRSADQTAYANWWYEFADIGWNRIARIQAAQTDLGLYMAARMFAMLNMAIADAYIAGWDMKNFYNAWRPYTAIRAAATDGNDATSADPGWEPLMPTPPVQDYPSTHAAVANTAAAVLSYFFGNHSTFSMTSTSAVPAGAIRSFKSFKEAADENADSRVMAGIHFRFSTEAGQQQGDKLGKWVTRNTLEPLH